MAAPLIYTAAEVADILGVHINSVYRLAAQGVLPCFYAGRGRGTWRMTAGQLEAYIAERTRANAATALRLFGPARAKTKRTA